MKYRKKIAEVIKKVSTFAAKSADGSASWFGIYQPKEPKSIKKLK